MEKLAGMLKRSREDWAYCARDIMGVKLDSEQEKILLSVQHEKMTSVTSGTARGKDFVTAVSSLCFLYTTPRFKNGDLISNTKVALTAPTDRQVKDIMMPEIARIHRRMVSKGFGFMAGELQSYGIKTGHEEWFLTGFKADEHNHEAWSGFHAVNTMFAVTEASGVAETIYDAIEGNLQGNSRILLVFNFNRTTGYAAKSQSSSRWKKFRLNSMNAPNVLEKKTVIPGQVDYEWVNDKVSTWCTLIQESDFNEGEGDFRWEGSCYRPNDLFRIKVLGLGPKESADTLIPRYWIELANQRWQEFVKEGFPRHDVLRLGVDVAGMGRDSSCFCPRYADFVDTLKMVHSGGKANHTEIAGITKVTLNTHADKYTGKKAMAFVDTIGEGAAIVPILAEQGMTNVYSCKFSEAATDSGGNPLTDLTGQYEFANLRAYLFWAVRDWLDPSKGSKAMLPPDDDLLQEATEARWKFQSNGKIIIEPKDDIKKRLGRSPDRFDALANTFYPSSQEAVAQDLSGVFF
ncbi:hypothetical protein EGT74_24485 [Chitinophaga lutea]|uniref:Terminase n=1 Tax=Chitinophaga lutea TaxID=2488634 RepID=A0A3N4Q2N7_9BACT|nr:hypothetical protein [Chitinophaga lutea]RPE06034.1 hypothetical protein EGT74_24485 [Chitinophaga lutea]